MKKHLLCSFIVALGLVFSMPVMAGFDDGMDDGDTGSSTESGDHRSDVSADFPYAYYFDILDTTEMTVSIEGVYMPQTTSVTSLTIPGELTENGLTYYVRSIRNLSFSGQAMIEDVIIEEGTETIHQDAFRYLTKLRYLQLPHTITEIGEGAFNNCDSLENIYWDVPDYRATTNAYGPFYGAREHITMMNFGENVRAIPAYFCYGMTQLQGFESGSDSIRTVRRNAFAGCTSLYWFPFYDGLDTIEAQAFMGCTGLSQGMSLPTSLNYVGDSAFANCTDLMSVDFNGNPDIYGRGVFAGCTTIETVTFPSTWDHIPDYVCENMTSLKSFSQLADYSGETVTQTPITSIGQYAFSGCSEMENLTIPSSVTTIGQNAFANCSSLKSIRSEAVTPPAAGAAFIGVPKTIPVIVPSGSEAAYRLAEGWSDFSLIMNDNTPYGTCGDGLTWMFSYADSTLYITGSGAIDNYDASSDATAGNPSPWNAAQLQSAIYHVSLDTTITTIGNNAFYGCSNIREMSLPASITNIGVDAFVGCSAIEQVYCYGKVPPTVAYGETLQPVAFPDIASTVPVYVPAQSYYTYKYRTGWSNLNIKYMSLSGTCGDNLQWVLNPNDSTFVITGTGSMIDYADEQKRPWVLYDENDMPTDYSMYVKTLSMPEGMTTIGKNAFYFFNITRLNIPSTVTTIGENGFDACSKLTEVTIPDNVTTIGANAFNGCKQLRSVSIGSGVSSIGSSAFGNCVSLMTMTISEQNSTFDSRDNCNAVINTSTNELVSGCNGTVIPNTVTSIASFAMSYCKSLTTITIPESVTLINGYAFNQCVALQSITSESVTPPTLKSGVFSGVPDTIPLYVPARGISAYQANSDWAYFKNILALPCDTTYRSEQNVTVLSTDLPYIWNGQELNESGTTQITLQTADGCDSIVTLTLTVVPSGSCGENLTWVFTAADSTLTITGTGEMYNYPEDTQSSDGGGTTPNQEPVTMAPWMEQELMFAIYHIQLPAGLTSIGSYAFYYLTNVDAVDIPSSVSRIGAHAFDQCGQMTTCTVAESGITEIGDYAFNECVQLLSFDIPTTVTTIGEDAFRSCSQLRVVHIPAGVTTIQPSTFYACQQLTAFTMEEGVQTIGEFAFNACKRLTKVNLPSTVTSIGDNAFQYCERLSSVDLSENLTSIGAMAFYECPFTEIVLPASLTTIGAGAFTNCENITSLTSEAITPPDCGSGAFEGVNTNIEVYVPYRSVSDYQETTPWSAFANIQAIPCEEVFRSSETAAMCEGDFYVWHDRELAEAGSYQDTLKTEDGCDSIVTLNLSYYPTYFFSDTIYGCENDLYEWHDRYLELDGIYYDSLRTVNGCDSIYRVDYRRHPMYMVYDSATICQGESFLWNDSAYTEAGQHFKALHTVYGCDSFCYLDLTVNPAYHFDEDVTIAETQLPYVWHRYELNESVNLDDTLQTVNGCDSIISLHLTVMPVEYVWVRDTVCYDELPYEWRGQQLVVSGYYFDTIRGVVTGLDSIIYANTFMAYLPVEASTETATICEGEQYEWHGMSLTEEGQYMDTVLNADGCDSICFLQLHVNPAYHYRENAVTCQGELFEWHGRYLETAGTYFDSLRTVHGCDSIYEISLTVNPMYSVYDTAYICAGDKYEWNGQSCTDEMQYMVNLHTMNGCDSFCYLQLYHYPVYFYEESETRCEGQSFEWHGRSIKTSGIYYDSLQTVHGCDSIYKLEMTYNPTYFFPETATICQGETYLWHDYEYTTAGIYYDSLTTLTSCDSVYELTLTVNPTYAFADEATICEGEAYSWHGYDYRQAGIYTDSLQTIHGCDSIWTLTLTVNPTFNVTDEATICQGETYTWHNAAYTEAGQYIDTLQTLKGCDSICTLILTVNPTYAFADEATICEGEAYSWHGHDYREAGIYTDSLQTIHGCDSIWTLTLMVNPTFNVTDEATICQGETYTWHDAAYTEAGQYIDTLQTLKGCDSICTLILTVNPTYAFADEATICEGEAYNWHNMTYREAGIYTDSLQTIHGCDSIWTLTLMVNPTFNVTDEATICQGETYTWHNAAYTEAGQYIDTLQTLKGCDSICTLILTVNPTYAYADEATICEGEAYNWHGHDYREAGIYTDSLQTIHGCDSIWTLTLMVNPTFNVTDEATICQGETYTWHNAAYTEAGQYIDTLQTLKGCDSICTLILTVNPTYAFADEATICEGEAYSWHDMTYREAGIYTDSLQTIHGCDSIWTLTLTVNPTFNVTDEATICQGETYTWHDAVYTEAGRYIDTLHTVEGCDSICNLVLTVNPTFDQTAEATICEGTTYSWHGKTYTTAGIYYDSLQTIHGCDSIWTLTLTVNPTYNVTDEATICQGETYTWHNAAYTEAGRYTDTLHTVNGCDSICNLVLTVNPTFEQAAEATICEGTTYSWHGKTYTTAGIYYDSLQTIHGCDSIWTLTLTVNRAYNVTEATIICQGETYTWHDVAYTEAGRYTDTLHTVNGCDSICNLVLTVNPTFDQTAEATICEGTTYSWHGKTYTTAGIYYDSLQTIHGCDSIWTLTLTINRAYNVTEATTICQGETYTWHDVAYTEAGRYTDTLHTINGCDSICNLVLTINPTFDQTEEATICEGTTYSWHGKTYTTAGIYYDSLQTIHGCDSIWTLTLTVNPVYDMTEEATICQGTSYRWQGSDYTTAGTYHDSLQTIYGCDSILTLVLTVNETYSSTEDVAICQGEAFEWHGQTYTTAGRYQMTLEAKNGCDSVCTLNLTVNATYTKQESAYICAGETYRWHDRDYTTAGIYHDTLLTIHGCDSICTLTLTVGSVTTMPEETMTVCAKELPIVWKGQSITAAGMYYDTVRNSYGCDSIYYSLQLIVNREITTTENAVICDGETITWHGRSLTKQGLYYDTLQTIHGCDSICVLNLTVNPSYYIEEIVSIREDKLPYSWQGQSITQAGTYYADYRTVNTDCDSIYTLQLMVTALPIYTVNVEADHGHVNGTGTYPEGTRITLTAVPDEGFEFQMWSDGSETNPKEFVVMQDTTFRAHFYMPEVEQEVTVDSIETHSVTITWDTVAGAVLYELRIYKNGQLVVTYEVDPDNNIIGEHHIGPDRIVARKDSTGGTSETLQVNIGGLEPGQDYTYSLDALDDDRSYVGAQSGVFTTEEEPGDGLDTLFDKQRHQGARKVLRDGQLFIELPDGTRYSPEGALLE